MTTTSGPKRVKRAKHELYRELLCDAAERVFAEHGYDATKVSWIAREAGVSLTTLYGVFPGKVDLYRAIHVARGAELMARTVEALDLTGAPLQLLLDGVVAYVTFHLERPDYLRMHLRDGGAWGVSPTTPTAEQTALLTRGIAAAKAVFARGIALGQFIPDDPAVMARTMIAMHQVRLADWVERGMPRGEASALIAAMKTQLIRTFCKDGPARDAALSGAQL